MNLFLCVFCWLWAGNIMSGSEMMASVESGNVAEVRRLIAFKDYVDTSVSQSCYLLWGGGRRRRSVDDTLFVTAPPPAIACILDSSSQLLGRSRGGGFTQGRGGGDFCSSWKKVPLLALCVCVWEGGNGQGRRSSSELHPIPPLTAHTSLRQTLMWFRFVLLGW